MVDWSWLLTAFGAGYYACRLLWWPEIQAAKRAMKSRGGQETETP